VRVLAPDVALAIHVLAHEPRRLAGVGDEATTERYAASNCGTGGRST
jgi:hypothetical protein